MRASYERAEHGRAVHAPWPPRCRRLPPRSRRWRRPSSAAAQHRDPLSAVGAVALGVQGRADEASALLDQGEYAQASSTAAEVVHRSDQALLVGLALPVLLLLLLAGAAFWWRGTVSPARRGRTGPSRCRPLATALRSNRCRPLTRRDGSDDLRRWRTGAGR